MVVYRTTSGKDVDLDRGMEGRVALSSADSTNAHLFLRARWSLIILNFRDVHAELHFPRRTADRRCKACNDVQFRACSLVDIGYVNDAVRLFAT